MERVRNVDVKLLKALIDLYLNVKVRSEENLKNCTKEQIDKERKAVSNTNPITIVDYIRSSIEILLNLQKEEGTLKQNSIRISDTQESYEEQIQKLEAETRMHIRVYL